jgi:hypothetical protein
VKSCGSRVHTTRGWRCRGRVRPVRVTRPTDSAARAALPLAQRGRKFTRPSECATHPTAAAAAPIRHKRNPGSRNPRGCSVLSLAAVVLPGDSRRSYDRSRRSRRCSRRGGRRCSRRGCRRCSRRGGRTRRSGRSSRRYRRSNAIVVVGRVLGVAGTVVFAASTPELGPGVTVRMHITVGVRVGAGLCPGDRRPACWDSQCSHRHETHERLLHSITPIALDSVVHMYLRTPRPLRYTWAGGALPHGRGTKHKCHVRSVCSLYEREGGTR